MHPNNMEKCSNSSVMGLKAQLAEARNLHIALKDLVEISVCPPRLKGRKSVTILENSTVDEVIRLTRQLCRSDVKLASQIESVEGQLTRTVRSFRKVKGIKGELDSLKALLETEDRELRRKTSVVNKVMTDYRTRCKHSFEESLKETDIELRKILMPLVPSEVLTEQVYFKPINPDSSLMGTMQRTEEKAGMSRTDLLVETIEKAAEGMLFLLRQITFTYWRSADPDQLGGLLTPLSESLPECFMYEVSTEQQRPDEGKYSKQKLLSKITSYKEGKLKQGARNCRKLSDLQAQLEQNSESILESDFLMNALTTNAFTLSETESLVYNIIKDPKSDADVISPKIVAGVFPQVPQPVQKIQLAEKLQSIRSRQRSSIDLNMFDLDLQERSSSRHQHSSKKRLSKAHKRISVDLDYVHSDRLLEELHFNEGKSYHRNSQRSALEKLKLYESAKLVSRPESKLKQRESQRKKKVHSVSPLPAADRSSRLKSVSPLKQRSLGKKLVIG
jgi:hypothetical protein